MSIDQEKRRQMKIFAQVIECLKRNVAVKYKQIGGRQGEIGEVFQPDIKGERYFAT